MTETDPSIAAQQLHGAGMATTLAFLAAGLGQFFIGVKLLGSGVKQMAGPGLHRLLGKVTKSTTGASALGVGVGSITQSASVATFVMASMVGAGLIRLRAAMPVVQWSNVGASALVFLATLDVTVAMFYLMGIVGTLYYLNFDESRRFRSYLVSIYGFALLFIGIADTQTASTLLSTEPWFRSTMDWIRTWAVIHFFVGTAMAYVARSSASVSVIAIAFAGSGLITEFDAVVLILGANTGTGLVALELSRRVVGAPRQLLVYQFVSKVIGLLIVGPFLIANAWLQWGLVEQALAWVGSTLSLRLAVAYLIIQITSCLVMAPFYETSKRLLERYLPEPSEVAMGKPRFLYDEAIADPNSALHLLRRERLRLAFRLCQYFRCMAGHEHSEHVDATTANGQSLHEANQALLGAMDDFTEKLATREMSPDLYGSVLTARSLNETLRALDTEAHGLARRCMDYVASPQATPAVVEVARNIGAMLVRLAEEETRLLVSGRPEDFAKLSKKVLHKHRAARLAHDMMLKLHGDLSHADQHFVLRVSTSVWQMDSLAKRILTLRKELAQLEQQV